MASRLTANESFRFRRAIYRLWLIIKAKDAYAGTTFAISLNFEALPPTERHEIDEAWTFLAELLKDRLQDTVQMDDPDDWEGEAIHEFSLDHATEVLFRSAWVPQAIFTQLSWHSGPMALWRRSQ